MNRQFIPLVSSVALMALVPQVDAANIALTDPSLESGFGGSSGVVISGWYTFGAATAAVQVDGGFWNMSNSDGTNAAYTVQISETDGGSIYQRVTLDAGVTYSFTVGVGMSEASGKSDGKFALVFFNPTFSSLLAQTTGTISTRGGFTDYTVEFTPSVTGDYQLGMRNRGYVPGTGANNNESTVFFDNARLTTVPEPSSAVLLCSLLGLGLIRRR